VNSSKAWGDTPKGIGRLLDEQRARPRRRAAIVGAAAILVLLAGGWWLVGQRPQTLLEQSRGLLAQVAEEPEATSQRTNGRAAERLLKRYRRAGGRHDAAACVLLCAASSIQSQPDQVQEYARQIVPAECPTGDLLLAAKLLSRSGEPAVANVLIEELLHRNEYRVSVLRLAIEVRHAEGREAETLDHCRELIRRAPTDPEPWLVMALIQERRSAWHEVVEPLEKYIELAPRGAGTYRLQLVRYLLKSRQVDAARRQLDRLQADAPHLVEQNPLIPALLLHAEAKPDQALQLLRRSQPRDAADREEAWELEGRILLAQAKPHEAARVLRKAVAADPTNHGAHHLLAQAYARAGEPAQAAAHLASQRRLLDQKTRIHQLERQAGREPTNVEIRLELARLCGQVGWTDLQREWLHAAEVARDLAIASAP
jgi:tetratricopeptide (TPR) repeat protein